MISTATSHYITYPTRRNNQQIQRQPVFTSHVDLANLSGLYVTTKLVITSITSFKGIKQCSRFTLIFIILPGMLKIPGNWEFPHHQVSKLISEHMHVSPFKVPSDIASCHVKANYEENLIHNFTFNNDSKIFIKSISFPLTVIYNSNSISTSLDKANLFNQYFSPLFSYQRFEDILFSTISLDISTSLKMMVMMLWIPCSKAMEIDSIGPKVLKECACMLLSKLNLSIIHLYQ